jgi:beta-aspartyl-peptidase (threonine type)
MFLQVRELPYFNAGRGSVLAADGTVEMDTPPSWRAPPCAAAPYVSGLSTVANPVSLARLVMERTPHVYLAFAGAEAFARDQVRASRLARRFLPSSTA